MKKITFLFALLCASVMGWAVDWTGSVSGTADNVWATSNPQTYSNGVAYTINYLAEYNDVSKGLTVSFELAGDILSTEAYVNGTVGSPNMYVRSTNTFYSVTNYECTLPGPYEPGDIVTAEFHITYNAKEIYQEFSYTIPNSGSSTPVVTGICESTVYSSNVAGYDIHAKVTKGCNKYYLTISSATEGKTITGLVGDNMFCNRYCDEARTHNNNYHMAAAGHYTLTDGKVIFTIPSVGDPKMYTPLNLRFNDNQAVEVTALNGVRLEPCSSEDPASCPDPEPTEIQDVNFALINNGALAYASNGNAWEAIDGNDGSRWESASSDPQWYVVDLGQRRIFNTVQIRWQTAYSRTFTIDVSNDGETWTTKKSEANYTEGGDNVEYEANFAENITARYVRLYSTARATQWGNSFFSFRVLLKGVPVLTSVELAANTTIAKVGEYAILTPSPKDQNNGAIAADLSYTVTPADAGHVTDNKYYPEKYGLATITVTATTANAEVTSSGVEVWGVLSDNLAYSSNIVTDNKVIDQSEVTGNATSAFYAVDGNKGSVWQACRDLEDNKTNAEFTSYYTLDLGNVYAINLIAIWFDGAASDEYTIEFSKDNTAWLTGFSISQHIGNHPHQKYLSTSDLNNNDQARYVRFTTTKASTTAGWGMKMFEMEVYGTEASTKKTVSATVSPASTGSVLITTGNPAVEVTEPVESGTSVTFTATPNAGYDFVNWTQGGVVIPGAGATYTTTITANTSLVANFEVHRDVYCHTEILTDDDKKMYLTISKVAENTYRIRIDGSNEVKVNSRGNFNFNVLNTSDYSNEVYNEVTGRGWLVSNEGNGFMQNTFVATNYANISFGSHYLFFGVQGGGNKIIDQHFPAANTIVWDNTCTDTEAPSFDKAEAEVLNESSVRLKIQATDNWGGILTYTIAREAAEPIISNHASGEEFSEDVTGLTAGTQYDFTVTVSDGVNNANTHILVTPVGDTDAPVMGEASLDSKTWHSAIINVAATDNKGVVAYYIVELDNEFVPSEGKITVDGLTEATAYTFTIKAKDAAGNTSNNYAEVSFTTYAHALVPQAAAPIPEVPANQVMSIYSDTYELAPANVATYNAGWWDAPTMTEEDIDGNHYLHYNLYRNGMIGAEFAQISMVTMEKIHIDIWASAAGSVTFRPITVGGPNTPKTLNLAAQQWNSFDMDKSEFAGHDWSKVFQFAIEAYQAGGLVGEHISVDNVYYYRTTPPPADETAPTAVTVNSTVASYTSATIKAQANDDSGVVHFKVLNGSDVLVADVEVASGAEATIVVNSLAPSTAYNLSLIAYDEAGHEAEPVAVAFSTLSGPAAAPQPTHDAIAVLSVFSDAYEPAVAASFNRTNWGSAPVGMEADYILYTMSANVIVWGNNDGNAGHGNIDGLSGHTYDDKPGLDISDMDYIHFDVWCDVADQLNTVNINDQAVAIPTTRTIAGQWVSFDVDITGVALADRQNLRWLKFHPFNTANCVAAIDNVYFWKAPVVTRDDSWMAPGELGTICIPQGAIATGGDIYELMGKDEQGKIVFATVTDNHMAPGKPYLFEATSNEMRFYNTGETPATEPDNSGAMKGSFSTYVLYELDGVCYFNGRELWSCSNLTQLNIIANRAYVQLNDVQPIQNSTPAPGRRFITMGVFGQNAATGIEGLNAGDQPVKVMIDGQLYILRGEKMYNANGQIVK